MEMPYSIRQVLAVVLICAGLVPVCSARTARRTAKRYSAKELIAKIIASEKKIHDVELHYDYIIMKDGFICSSFDWGYEGGKEYFAGKQFNRARGDKPAYVDYVKVAFDGEKVRRFRDSERDKFTRGRICPFKDGHFIFPTPNHFLGYDISIGRRTFGEILRDVPKISLREQPEVIDGHRCRVLEAIGVVDRKLIFDVRAWIDTERDFRPLKIERYQSIGGKKRWKVVRQQIEKVKLQKIDGVWFPVEGTSSTFFIKNILPPVGMTETEFFRLPRNRVFEEGEFVMMPDRYGSVRIKVYEDTVRINKGIAPEKFTIEFPHGCRVYDDYAEISYTIGEPDKEKTISKSVPVPDSLTVSELLDKYAETQDKIQSFRIVTETQAKGATNHPISTSRGKTQYKVFHSDLAYDGERISNRLDRWLNMDSPPDKPLSKNHKAYNYMRSLWDGKYAFSYTTGSVDHVGTLSINTGPYAKANATIARSGAGFIMGILSGDSERIDTILRKAKGIHVRQQMDKVGDSQCYVIEADIRHGKYTLWIDPAHGYNIARAEVRKKQGNLAAGKPLGAGFSISSSFKVTRFEQVDGMWLPMEAYLTSGSKWPGGHFSKGTSHVKRTSVTLNPDHEALGSFVLDDVPDGAKVRGLVNLTGGRTYTGSPKYLWSCNAKFVVEPNGRPVVYDPNQGHLPVVKTLPRLRLFDLKLNDRQTQSKSILLCFWDMSQRSQQCIQELAEQAKSLKEKDVIVILVHVREIKPSALKSWAKKNKITFPVGRFTRHLHEELRQAWGIEKLPWLVMTDCDHIVIAEGFSQKELAEKIKGGGDVER